MASPSFSAEGGSAPSRFDVVVVGAGPGGSSAAFTLAQRGYRVLLIDRGRRPGTKNMYGGRVYVEPLEAVYPSLREEAPIHRWVRVERLGLVSEDGMVSVEYRGGGSKSFTTYLPELVGWMAGKAEEAGALVVTEVGVDDLVIEGGRVIGVRAGPDVVYADVVIDAEGVNRLLLEGARLAETPDLGAVAIGLKETIKLDRRRVNERFGLDDGEGLAWMLMGDVTAHLPGGAFVYTNRDSVSVGLVLFLSYAIEGIKTHIFQLLEGLRLHPHLKHLWMDGELVEYSARLTPEYWRGFMPRRLSGDGLLVVGDASGLLFNNGLTIRGVDFAAYSGHLAAEAYDKAHAKGDFSANALSLYDQMVGESFIGRELRRHRGLEHIRRHPRFFERYPRLAAKGLGRVFDIGLEGPTLWEAFRGAQGEVGLGTLTMLSDLLRVVRGL